MRLLPKTLPLEESLLVAYYVVVANRGQDADFIESVFGLLIGEIAKLDFFEGIYLPICESFNFVDG
jgi:hypothetical protein